MFQDGSIHDARFGDLGGAEAVYGILRLMEGDFALEPDTTPSRTSSGFRRIIYCSRPCGASTKSSASTRQVFSGRQV